MRLRPYIPGCAEVGFTLIELLVAVTIGLLALGLTLSSVLYSRNAYRKDVARTRINQDLRGALDIIGSTARVAGENFNGAFPAIEVIDGVNGAPDELILRRNLLDEVLKVCVPIVAGTAADLIFAYGSESGCVYAGNTHNYEVWRAWRQARDGSVRAYVFDTSTDLGEYFDYSGEIDSNGQYAAVRASGTWANDYSNASSAAYIMEEWRFRVSDDTLQLIENGESDNPLNVAFGVTDMQVEVFMQEGGVQSTFSGSDNWTLMQSIGITLTGQELFRGEVLERQLSARFFPRNVLSN
ncbi:MAG: hypothetical protein GX589_05095 [Deltaproteobacteria bacterium]|nr:hypothetical protein [Deltaproteobacteria bacterium]